jgi:hypothetical protein
MFITGIPYARDSYRQFLSPVYSVFNALGREPALVRGSIAAFIRRIVSAHEIFKGYLHDHIQKAVLQMQIGVPGSTHQGMNLAILNPDGIQEHSAEWVARRNHYTTEKLPQTSALADQLIYPLIFWNGQGGLGMIKNESVQGVTTRFRKIVICLTLQPREHFIHSLEALWEKFLCAINGRLVNLQVKRLLGHRQHVWLEKTRRREREIMVTRLTNSGSAALFHLR